MNAAITRPSYPRMCLNFLALEFKQTLRDPAALGFGILFPIVLLVLFASIFSGDIRGTDVTFSQLYVAGIVGSSIMSRVSSGSPSTSRSNGRMGC